MAEMKQIEDANTTYLGWYGKCGEPKCESFDLNQVKDQIASVYQFTKNGTGIKTYVSNVPEFLQGFTELQCGNSYWFVLKKGSSSVDIPELTLGYVNEGESLGSMSEDCYGKTAKPDPTPTPTPTSDDIVCTQDVRECPDGEFVSRNAKNNCRFPVCGWDAEKHKNMYTSWVYNQPVHYSYDFKYIGIDSNTEEVSVRVLFNKIVSVKKRQNEESISVDEFNDSITDAEQNNRTKIRYLTPTELFGWINYHVTKKDKTPYSVDVKYGEFDHMKSAIIDIDVDERNDQFGFEIWNLKELDYNGKCPPQKKKCPDGTYVKRDPENNCRFMECGEKPTPTPVEVEDVPKLKFRWLVDGDNSILQVANIPNPYGDEPIPYYRTVYGSRIPPKRQTNKEWPHVKLSKNYAKKYGSRIQYEGMLFYIDSVYDNQLVVRVGGKSDFYPNADSFPSVSHLYLFDEDDSPEDYHASAFTFPHIRKSNQVDLNADFASEEPDVCTEDIKICPDGTLEERDPYNDCEFYPCPDREMENVDDSYTDESSDDIAPSVDSQDIDGSLDFNDYDTIYDSYADESSEDIAPSVSEQSSEENAPNVMEENSEDVFTNYNEETFTDLEEFTADSESHEDMLPDGSMDYVEEL